jgi:hypothetical protein
LVEIWTNDIARQHWDTLTIRLTPVSGVVKVPLQRLISQIFDIFLQELENIKNIDGMVPSLVFQPVKLNDLKGFNKNGGNAIGIKESDGPLMRTSFPFLVDVPDHHVSEFAVRNTLTNG